MQPHPTCGVVNPAVVQQVLLASPPNVLLLEGTTPRYGTSFPKKECQALPGLRRPGGEGEAFQRGGVQRSGTWTPASYTQCPELGEEEEEEKEDKGTRVALPLKMVHSICMFPACFQRRVHEITGRRNTRRVDVTTTHARPTHVHFQACGRISSPQPLGTGMAT